MRILMLVAVLALTGCSTARAALGEYQKAADKGVGIGTASEAEAAAASAEPAESGAARRDLPATLGGDAENRVYSAPPKR